MKAKEQYDDDLPEVRAWEVDLNGNVKEVVPLSQRAGLQTISKSGHSKLLICVGDSVIEEKKTYKN